MRAGSHTPPFHATPRTTLYLALRHTLTTATSACLACAELRRASDAGSSSSIQRERAQVESLVLNAQGPVEMADMRTPRQETDGDGLDQALDLDGMLTMMSSAFVGAGGDDEVRDQRRQGGGQRLLATQVRS